MKLEKKHWMMLIAGVVVLFLVYYFLFKKRKTESGYSLPFPGSESGYNPNFLMLGDSGYAASDINGGVMESGYAARDINGGVMESGFVVKKEVRVPQQQTAKCPEGSSWGKVGSYDIWDDGPPLTHTSVPIMGCVGVGSGAKLPQSSAYFAQASKSKRGTLAAKMHCYKTVGGVTTEIDCSTLPKQVKDVLTKA
jgi:hypothetical protein